MKLETFDLPAHWAAAFINGDLTAYSDEDVTAIEAFTAWMVAEYGQCHCLDVTNDEGDFRTYHDANRFGALACNVCEFTFDVTRRA